MKENKWTPHIIAATVLVVFIVLGLACASSPGVSVNTSMMDSSIPLNGQSEVYVGGRFVISIDNGATIMASSTGAIAPYAEGTVFVLPAGEHSFTGEYTYYRTVSQGTYRTLEKRGTVSFSINYDLLPGQFYYLFGASSEVERPQSITLLTEEEASQRFDKSYLRKMRDTVKKNVNETGSQTVSQASQASQTQTAGLPAGLPAGVNDFDASAHLTPFDGHWEKPDGNDVLVIIFQGHTYTMLILSDGGGGEIIARGVFRHTGMEMTLQSDSNYTMTAGYTLTGGEFSLSGITGNESWMNGVWSKMTLSDDIDENDPANFLPGTWIGAFKSGGFGIVQFWPGGRGIYYSCDNNYIVDGVGEVRWDPTMNYYAVYYGDTGLRDNYRRLGEDMIVNEAVLYKKVGQL